jgi:hypothetical protein
MFDSESIKELKQVNISKDAEKTKERITDLWKHAPKPQRQEILTLAGVTLASIQRAYKTGNISAKLVVPLAQVLGVNPFYLIGESDDAGPCTDKLLNKLIGKQSFKKSAKGRNAVNRGLKRRKKQSVADEQGDVPNVQSVIDACPEPQPDLSDNTASSDLHDVAVLVDALTEEDLSVLLKALLLRAKAGGKYAEVADKVKLLLLF